MNYKVCLYVKDIEDINRTIIVNDDIELLLFVKCLIISMNGNSNELFFLENSDEILEVDDCDTLASLNLEAGIKYQIEYNYSNKVWILEFEVLEKNKGLKNNQIEIIDGSGYGICSSEASYFIKNFINSQNENWKEDVLSHSKTLASYFNFKFVLDECNKKVNDYILIYQEGHKPKSLIMNIALEGFNKEIKRKIVVNNNILIDKFCRGIISSMNGYMDHLYTIKINKKWYDENVLDEKLSYLDLLIGNKFKVIYDYGDNWEFNVKVVKIIDGYNEKEFEVLEGIGYGIVEDCGGKQGLCNVFNGQSDYFEKEDINEFDLEETQKYIDKELKKENLHLERIDWYC